MPKVPQPVTDDSIKVRQLTHYQFSWVGGEPGQPGTLTLQLVLDQGAWEEVLTVDAEDADVLQALLSKTKDVHYDIGRRTLMFGVSRVGS
ncbi:hypothetical protein [Agromyces sp. NPDC049794]|uniref:hypothetical protein n=1 Tax=unclassified Agromyces TaxID=2639701 RepID=UPI0033D6C911